MRQCDIIERQEKSVWRLQQKSNRIMGFLTPKWRAKNRKNKQRKYKRHDCTECITHHHHSARYTRDNTAWKLLLWGEVDTVAVYIIVSDAVCNESVNASNHDSFTLRKLPSQCLMFIIITNIRALLSSIYVRDVLIVIVNRWLADLCNVGMRWYANEILNNSYINWRIYFRSQ